MKVLFLCYRGNPFCGGQGIYLYYLSRELAKLGVEADVIVGPPYPDPLESWAGTYKMENLNIWAVNTDRIPFEKLRRIWSPLNFADYVLTRLHKFSEMETFSMRAFFQLSRLLKKRKYDIIHDVQSLGWGLLLMKAFGIPIVTTVHHPLTRDRDADLSMDKTFWEKIATLLFYPLVMQKAVINRVTGVITSFNEGVNEINRAFGVSREKISVVYNGMDVEVFRNSGEAREKNSLLFVGNTEDHKKGLLYLIEALSMLPEDITLTIVDEGPPAKCKADTYIKKFGVAHRVVFTGKVSLAELVSLYSRKTILVMSSLYEGFGLPAAEAMACETPVIATSVGALPEVVSADCGILVPPENPAALRDAVLELINDHRRMRSMGLNGRNRAENNFAWPVAAANTLEVYKRIIEKHRRRG